jgi:hypothetical protein
MQENNQFRSLLQNVVLHWDQSAKAYAEYMENGKKFRYAELLRLHNTAVKDLLSDNIATIPDDFQKAVEEIIEHYTIWTVKWDELKSKMNPGPDDEFVFANEHRFPKKAAQKLEAALNSMS